ncbi:amidohydrolase family protein [Hirschia baltica]|uniref:Amidohydrolase n=1 Tax=Hirschia baltica (strain ATCC 49814 / DSM 5838 / IFAM 1418) TaxID=582402 RepID=C6XP21_HIRBI|nr:amidohydrolase family protein [Hirschia baltica]ACT60201.1 amidohydrolase [Hirschia baltica ATCC 49814]
MFLRFIVIFVAWASACTAYAEQTPKNVSFELEEGSWMSLDISPDGKWIAFDLLNDIYIMSAEGGEAKAILSGPATQKSPQFSSDGKTLAYISDASGHDNIWTASVKGKKRKQISFEERDIISSPAWSPSDEAIIAVVREPEASKVYSSTIREYYVDGSEPKHMVDAPGGRRDVQEPRYSPDGEYLYYTQRVGGDHYVYVNTGLKNFNVMRAPLKIDMEKLKSKGHYDAGRENDGRGKKRKLHHKRKPGHLARPYISGFGSATTAEVSPDGQKIAFIRRHKAQTVLFTFDTETRRQTPVYSELSRDLQSDYLPQEHYYPSYAWFPDNRHIAIWSKGKILRIDMENGDASTIPFKLTSKHEIQPPIRVQQDLAPETVDVKTIRNPVWIADDKIVVFRALSKLWQKDLTNNTPITAFTGEDKSEFEPALSFDRDELVYVSWDDETGSELRYRDLKTGQETVLVSTPGTIRDPVFSHSGKLLAYRIMPADPSMSAPGPEAGIYTYTFETEEIDFVEEADKLLQFSKDDSKLYYIGAGRGRDKKEGLFSVSLNGENQEEHAYTTSYNVRDLDISPDEKWLAFKDNNDLFIAPFKKSDEAWEVSEIDTENAKMIAPLGGYDLSWSNDGLTLRWTFGPTICEINLPAKAEATCDLDLGFSVEAPEEKGLFAFVGGRVIPIEGDVIENGVVVVEGNKIKLFGRQEDVAIPDEAQIVDITGKTIMPGFLDAHGHIDCCYGVDVMPQKHAGRYAALAYGVTTNFDPYSNDQLSYEAGEMTAAGQLVGPRWFSSAQVIHGVEGRWGGVYHEFNSLDEARDIMTLRKAMGPSVLKTYKFPSRQKRQWLVKAAREAGYMVDAEGAGQFYTNISMLLDGHTNLEHNLPVDTYYKDLQELFKASEVSATPTLIVVFGALFGENYIYQNFEFDDEVKIKNFVPDVNNSYNPITGAGGAPLHVRCMHSIKASDTVYDVGFRSVARTYAELDRQGVPVNVGSHGQVSGLAIHWEMILMAQGGMTPERILRAATINGARSFGLDHQLGSIKEGKLADLIVLDENPLENIENTNSVSMTMINGRLFDAETMQEIGPDAKPRSKFYWELQDTNGIDWNPAWGGE